MRLDIGSRNNTFLLCLIFKVLDRLRNMFHPGFIIKILSSNLFDVYITLPLKKWDEFQFSIPMLAEGHNCPAVTTNNMNNPPAPVQS